MKWMKNLLLLPLVCLSLAFLAGCGPIGAIKKNQKLIQDVAYGATVRNPQDNMARQTLRSAQANVKNGVNVFPPVAIGLAGTFLSKLADPATGGPVGALLLTGLAYFRKRKEQVEAIELAKEVTEMEPLEARQALLKSKVKV